MASSFLSISTPSPAALRRPAWRHKLRPTTLRCAAVQLSAGNSTPEALRVPEKGPLSEEFLRFRRMSDDDAGGELQTSIVSYRKRFPWFLFRPSLQVDLVSTIHIADKEYFEILKSVLEPYDCVLYEMVTSKKNLERRKNRSSTNRLKDLHTLLESFTLVGFIQREMAQVLSLYFQLDCLDYQNEKWCHADLDLETFETLQNERGENLFTFARETALKSVEIVKSSIPENVDPWRSKLLWASRFLPMPIIGNLIIGSVCDPQPLDNEVTEYPEFEAMTRLDFGAAMKIFIAKRLTSMFTQMDAFDDTVIIGERNKVAAQTLRQAIDNGKNRIAILYGGGHMPDLARRLKEEFDMVPSEVQWVTAWLIKSREEKDHSLPFLNSLAQLTGWPLNLYETSAWLIFSSIVVMDLFFWNLVIGTVGNWVSWISSECGVYADHFRIL